MSQTSGTGSRLSTKTLFSYGIGAVGEGIGYNVFFAFFTYFLTTVAGIAPAVAGVISGVAVLWDAVTDPMIGVWSDRTRNRRGRRRPFIMVGSILFGVSIALLFTSPNLSGGAKTAYYVVVNMFYWFALTTCVIPHISLGSELTENFDERTKLRTFAVTLMNVGTLIAVGTPLLLVSAFGDLTHSPKAGWAMAGATYGILVILVYQVCCRLLRGKEPANPNLMKDSRRNGAEPAGTGEGGPVIRSEEEKARKNFFANAAKAFRNKALVHLLVITFFINIVVTLGSGLAIYLLKYVYRYGDAQSSLVYTLQGVFVVGTAVLIGIVATKTGKKAAMIIGVVFYIMAYLVILLFPVCWPVLLVSLILYAVGNAGYWTMIYAMSYDAAIVEQVKSGERPDGLYTSLIGLFMKFGNAIGSVIVGVGLQIIGFSELTEVQTEGVVRGIRRLYAVAPAVVLVPALVFAFLYPITKKRYEEYQRQCETKTAAAEEQG